MKEAKAILEVNEWKERAFADIAHLPEPERVPSIMRKNQETIDAILRYRRSKSK